MAITRGEVKRYPVEQKSDIGVCRRSAVNFAKELGFNDILASDIAIIVSELTSNIINHGGKYGFLLICSIQNEKNKKGLEFWGCDNGRGISNKFQVINDGYSSHNSLGIGLGSIQRLSDEFEINPKSLPKIIEAETSPDTKKWTVINSRKWLLNAEWKGINKNITIGAASRPKPGENQNGDEFIINHLSHKNTLIAVIDGLGHGKNAAIASQVAKEQIQNNQDLPLNNLMDQIHCSLKGTRGATIGIACIDQEEEQVQFCGIGNVECYVITKMKKHNLLSSAGIVGHNIRTPRIYNKKFEYNDCLILHSDGIKSSWYYDFNNWEKHPQCIAEEIINLHSRLTDDATFIIARNTSQDR